MTSEEIRQLLDREATRINAPEFIADDPVQFPRRFSDIRDVEITALVVASIAWGRRTMILRDAERILLLMGQQPYKFTMEQGYLDLDPDRNLHRTFFCRHLQVMLAGLRAIYSRHSSLDAFSASLHAGESEAPAWLLTEGLVAAFTEANGGNPPTGCLPLNLQTTALKRINMALRWLVRDDGIVDMGLWHSIPKSRLFIPLDVHSGNTARQLGLLSRKANDRKSAVLLTEAMRELRPDDPAFYDFALFGLGVEGKKDISSILLNS